MPRHRSTGLDIKERNERRLAESCFHWVSTAGTMPCGSTFFSKYLPAPAYVGLWRRRKSDRIEKYFIPRLRKAVREMGIRDERVAGKKIVLL